MIWLAAMVRAAPVMNADTTGSEMKSISMPMNNDDVCIIIH